MKGVIGCAILLSLMALTDVWFSSRLLASIHQSELTGLASQTAEIDTVEQALNSRYMQWGAVGVMIGLFVWIITVHQPRQEKTRDAERKASMDTFLATIEKKDTMYLGTLNEIRRSVEDHVERNHASHDKLSDCVNALTHELRGKR